MATGIQANGTDLDSVFEARTTTKIADVNIDSNGGVDLSNRFEDIASGSAAAATGIQSGGADLNTLFAGIGTVGSSPTVSALANGDTNSRIIGTYCDVGVQFNTAGTEHEQAPNGTWGASLGDWLDSGSASDVWVVFTRTSGSNFDSHTSGTRYNLGSTQSFTIRAFDVETVTVTGYFQFYDAASGGNLLQTTSTVSWQATSSASGGMCSLC